MGARIILNSRYFRIAKDGEKANGKTVFTKGAAKGLLEYVATRETVSLNINEDIADYPATIKQEDLIDSLLEEYPQGKDSLEYIDYLENKTIKNASEFISRVSEFAVEEAIVAEGEASNLVEYVAKRPGVVTVGEHGLFGIEDNIDLTQAMDKIADQKGRVWTHVISLRREDADRLGFDSQVPWRNLVLKHMDTIAENSHISLNNFKWYAGMHNTGHHPHIHLFAYSSNPKEGFLNKEGITNIKAAFAQDIFADDLKESYVHKTEYRNELKAESEDLLKKITQNPQGQFAEIELDHLSLKLEKLSLTLPENGRMFYKFQTPEIKKQIDEIIKDMVDNAPELNKLYKLWCKEQLNINSTYINEPEENFPITENKSFYSLKNMVLREADKLRNEKLKQPEEIQTAFSDIDEDTHQPPIPLPDMEDIPPLSEDTPTSEYSSYPTEKIQTNYAMEQQIEIQPKEENAKSSDDDFDNIKHQAIESRDPKTCYQLAKSYLYGNNVKADMDKAQMWFGISAAGGYTLSQYELGKMYLYGRGIEANPELGNEYLLEAYYNFGLSLKDTRLFFDIKDGNIALDTEIYIDKDGNLSEREVPHLYEKETSYGAYTQYLCGLMCYKGEGVELDYVKAEKWFQQAANNGYAHAYYYLGNLAFYGLGQEQDYNKACMMYFSAADKNDRYAHYRLGQIYRHGLGTSIDYKKAEYHLQKASEKNVSQAKIALAKLLEDIRPQEVNQIHDLYASALDLLQSQYEPFCDPETAYQIGNLYLHGKGTNVDFDKSIEWFVSAADKDHAPSLYELGNIYRTKNFPKHDEVTAHNYYQKALQLYIIQELDTGDSFLQYRIGRMYEYGEGTEKNGEEAAKWYQKAADDKHLYAMYALAKMYYSGDSIPQDYKKAFQLFLSVAEQENFYAQYNVANMYLLGQGTEKNANEALLWYKKAANNNHAYAQYKLGELYSDPKNDFFNPNESEKYFTMALKNFVADYAEEPSAHIAYRLGGMYEHGQGTEVNLSEAISWYEKAANDNHAYAQYKLGGLYSDPKNNFFNPKESEKYYAMALEKFIVDYAEEPSAYIAYRLGGMYEHGQGTEANLSEAISWYEKAANNNHAFAQYKLGDLYSDPKNNFFNPKESEKYYAMALEKFIADYAEEPSAYIAYRLGGMYEHGQGTEVNLSEAISWYEKAANDNHAYAQYKLGGLFSDQKNIFYNPIEAQKYYAMALNQFMINYAEEPNSSTAYQIANLYEQGKGTIVNLSEAISWYGKAANDNHAYAQCKLGDIYCNKELGFYNPELGKQYHLQSLTTFLSDFTKKPTADTALKIGTFYHYGKGVEQNSSEAEKWYLQALNMGSDYAQDQLDKLHQYENQITPQTSIFSLLSHMAQSIENDHQHNLKQRYIPDRKIKSQQKRQKMNLGQNKDDHEMDIQY